MPNDGAVAARVRLAAWMAAAAGGGAALTLAVLWRRRRRQPSEPENEPAVSFVDGTMPMYHGGEFAFQGWPPELTAGPELLPQWSPPAEPRLLSPDAAPDGLAGLPFGAVVHFTNCAAALDLCYPWRVQNPGTATGTGFIISGSYIVTNHHVIRSSTSIRVQRHGVPGNYEARVLVSSALCDLALVTVDDPEFWKGAPTCKLQDSVPELNETVIAVGYPMQATTVTLTRGVVSNVHLKDLSLTELNEKQLTIQIDAAINPGNSGGPVFNHSTLEVVGVAFAVLKEADGQGFIIPTPVLHNFIRVFETTGNFAALPSLGLRVQTLSNPSMRLRAFGGKPTHHDGIIVTALMPFSCATQAGVRVGDVLMSVDGMVVSEDAEIVFRGHEHVHYSHAYTQKSIGDTVHLSLMRRDGEATLEMVELDVTLTACKALVPRELGKDYKPDYLIVGGLVLLVAGVPLAAQLESRGKFGPRQQAVVLAEQDADDNDDPEAQAVIVGDCLAHELNVTYQMFIGHRLKQINGTAVQNIAHAATLLRSAVAQAKAKPFIILHFEKCKETAEFEIATLLAAMPTILAQHKIPSWTSLPLELAPLK